MAIKKTTNKNIIQKIILVTFWLTVILICIINRDKITIDAIVNFSPENTFVAICLILLLFAVKSVSVVIYGGIIYAASGIMFPLPLAIAVNTVGTVIMVSIPFYIGKKAGSKILDSIVHKNPKLEIIKDIPNQNELFTSFITRIVGLLPSDLVGIYLGASGMSYKKYLLGSVAGLYSAVISFSVMGMSADDVTSPAFIISAAIEIGLMLLSVILCFGWRKKRKKNKKIGGFRCQHRKSIY